MEYEEHMRTLARDSRQKEWSKRKWTPSPALVGKGPQGMATKYKGQQYDPEQYELVHDGWDHDHCLFCWQSICDCGGENCTSIGFTDGDDWICESCHQRVIVEKKDPKTN